MSYQPYFNSSLLSQMSDNEIGSFNSQFKNTALRLGAIIDIFETDHELNQSKLMPEYNVVCIEQDENRGITTTIYKNCISLDGFGSIADFIKFKRRTPKNRDFKNNASFKDQDSNLVLIMCIDGVSEKGIIIGGVSHPSSKAILDKAKELHFESEYNGLNVQINKDGELSISFSGATDNQGMPKTQVGISTIKIEKDGSIQFSDEKTEKIRIDKSNQTISINSEKDQSFTTNSKINIISKDSSNISCKDLIIKASGSATMTSDSSFSIKGSVVDIKASSIGITSESTINIKGASVTIEGQSVFLGAQGGTPIALIGSQSIGIGNMGSPVVSTIITGASKVFGI